jgi:pilus assembly protein Flp/PilA
MNSLLLNLYTKFQILMDREDGQDLVEYALAVALIAFAAVAGTRALAAGIGIAFSNLSSILSSSIV